MERIDSNTVVLTPEEAADSVFQGAIRRGLLEPGVYLDPSVAMVDGRVTLTFSKCVPKPRRVRTRHRRRAYPRQQEAGLSGGQVLACMFAVVVLFMIVAALLMQSEQPLQQRNQPSGNPGAGNVSPSSWLHGSIPPTDLN